MQNAAVTRVVLFIVREQIISIEPQPLLWLSLAALGWNAACSVATLLWRQWSRLPISSVR